MAPREIVVDLSMAAIVHIRLSHVYIPCAWLAKVIRDHDEPATCSKRAAAAAVDGEPLT
jgi:hypothetical protein